MATTVTIIEQISTNEVIVKCSRCNGYGTLGKNFSDPECPTCNGKGKLLLECDRLPLVECKRCSGYGTLGKNFDDPLCPSCRGAGCQPIAGEWRIIS